MADYGLDPIAANCYPGTTVLINKFGYTFRQISSTLSGKVTEGRNGFF